VLALLPSLGTAAPLTATQFQDWSRVGAHEAGVVWTWTSDNVTNDCAGVPLVCESVPTAATQSYLRTSATAFTDGVGGSGLGIRSRDGHVEAIAETHEQGLFDVIGPDPIDVHVQGFFPSISLFGIFAPGSVLGYDIIVSRDGHIFFETHGSLTDTGFTSTGDDIGAVFDARHHAVFAPPFLLDRTFQEEGEFGLMVTKRLKLTGTDWVEIADARMTDPEGVSAPGIVRNGVAGTIADVPEPTVLCLMGVALAYAARSRRVRCK
jgi:hypothetical protein